MKNPEKYSFGLTILVLCTLYLILNTTQSIAQTMVLQEDRSEEQSVSDKGPNLKMFTHFLVGTGLSIDKGETGASIKHGFPGDIFFGTRTKYKVSRVYSYGWGLKTHWQYYRLRQNEIKSLPDSVLHESERFQMIMPELSLFNRINFDPKRGNFLGRYLDFGIAGFGALYFSHVAIDKNEDKSKRTTTTTKLSYRNKLGYGVFARLGNNKTSLYVNYRLSDFFESKYGYPELPRIMAGIDLAIFKY